MMMSLRDRIHAALTLAAQLGGPSWPPAPPVLDGAALARWAGPLVEAVVRSVRPLPGLEREDLAQEALVGVVRAARTFDPTREGSFRQWAARHAIQQVLGCVRWVQRHEADVLAEPLDGEDAEEAGRPLTERLGCAEDPAAAVLATPRQRLAWTIAALARRAGREEEAALDVLVRGDADERAAAAAREVLRPVVAAALAAVIRSNSLGRIGGRLYERS